MLAFEASGLRQNELCRSHGLALSTLQRPPGRIFRDAIEGPGLQRPGEGCLDYVLCQRKMLEYKNSCQGGDHLPCFMPKKMFHHLGHRPLDTAPGDETF